MTPAQLKASILQYAIEGKLVAQRAEDGDAETLYKEIRKEKAKLIKDGKLKKQKPLPAIIEKEIPFAIPKNWKWVRLGEISDYAIGKPKLSPSAFSGKEWLLDLADIEKDTGRIIRRCLAHEKSIAGERVKFSAGQVLYSRLRPYLRKILVAPAEGICTSEIVPFSLYGSVNPHFIVAVLACPYIDDTINSATYGVKMPRVGTDTMTNLLIPLPPLAEQQRIVTKLNALLPLIDRYGDAYTRLTELRTRFPADLKKSILQYAIEGKLVAQRAEDGNAETLYKEIQKEKAKLIKDGKLKKQKPLPAITEKEIPFAIPKNWKWVRLGEIVFNHGQTKPNTMFSYIDIGSIDNKRQKMQEGENLIAPENVPSRARRIVQQDDILYATVRPYLHNMCIVDRAFSATPIASTGFSVMHGFTGVYNKFLFYYLMTPSFDEYANAVENAKGVAYPAINDERLYRACIPLPPLAEQQRIVAKLETLLPLCERFA